MREDCASHLIEAFEALPDYICVSILTSWDILTFRKSYFSWTNVIFCREIRIKQRINYSEQTKIISMLNTFIFTLAPVHWLVGLLVSREIVTWVAS